MGSFPIVQCIILHSRLITHLRNCKFGDVMYFAERYPVCTQFPSHSLRGSAALL